MNNSQKLSNPFEQSEELWLLSLATKYRNIHIFEDFFEEKSLAVSSHELSSQTVDSMPEDDWMVEIYFGAKPDVDIIPDSLKNLLKVDSTTITKVEHKDWTEVALSSLGEIKTNMFHIVRSSEYEASNLIPILLNLTRAFGTGEHATTMGCLESLESYADKEIFHVLDIGTGTGILAIAAKKLWPHANVVATDIDAVAIEITGDHALSNNVALEMFVMDGVTNLGLDRKYDMILANILARPLIEMSPHISALVKQGGIAILSGFLENQMSDVLKEYEAHGLAYVSHLNKNNWITLVLSKH